MSVWKDLLGTSKSFFRLGFAGPRLKDAGGGLAVRNGADTADADLTAAKVTVSGDRIVLNAGTVGGERMYTLRCPDTGMAAPVTLTLPATAGLPNQVLATDGNGVLHWVDLG